MIDTIILKVPTLNYHIFDHSRFNPSTRNLEFVNPSSVKYINNATSEETKKLIYRPRLTITKRAKGVIPLKIEFSIPKMIFGNNLDEVNNGHLPLLLSKLQLSLEQMGVHVNYENLSKAPVSNIHYSKNFIFNNGWTSTLIIKELSKVNLTKHLDLSKISFKNEGTSLQYYSKVHSFVIYDKIKDLEQSLSRAIDKDQNKIQKNLLKLLKEKFKRPEILRLEVRLTNKRKLLSTVSKLGFGIKEPTLSNLFSSKISQKVLSSYWDNYIYDHNLFLFLAKKDPCNLLRDLMNYGINPKKAIYLIGILACGKDQGMRELRQIVLSHSSLRTWQRISIDTKKLNELTQTLPKDDFIEIISKQLKEYKSFKI
jgi:hypothetical protein